MGELHNDQIVDPAVETAIDTMQHEAEQRRHFLPNWALKAGAVGSSILALGATGAFTLAEVGSAVDASPAAAASEKLPPLQYKANIGGATLNIKDIETGKVIIGEDEHIQGVEKSSATCFWTKGGFTNSMYSYNSEGKLVLVKYWDPVSAELCRDKNSPLGFIKVAGGTTGRDCGNAAAPAEVPGELKISQILNVNNLNSEFTEYVVAKGELATACGVLAVNDSVSIRLNLMNYMKSEGSSQSRYGATLSTKIKQKITGKIACKPAVVTTTTPTTTTTETHTTGTTTTETQTTTTGTTTTSAPPQESISIIPLTTAEPMFPNTTGEQLCVDAEYSPANGGTPVVTFAVTSGEGKIEGGADGTYQDSDGNPDHQCAKFDNGADIGESTVTATATGDNATASTQFKVTTQQDSGF